MFYKNPVVRGFYPDPSVCRAGDRFYMVCSTMMFFPGVPLFESDDLVNWKQIGHCLTRESQIDLSDSDITSGVFAPTIRYNDGRFYMVTTNAANHKNFLVYTDDIYSEWSEPVYIDQEGIDPSLFFEDGRTYFITNGGDEKGSCIIMSEIDVLTGEKISPEKALWRGTGGRFMEAPHLYKFGEYYYVLDAEGGTEYGHMVNYARSKNMWGPFEHFPGNPVITNRNLGGFMIQGAGHGDIIEDKDGNRWFMHLAFRQQGQWQTYHQLGRECCLVPLEFKDGWFFAGRGVCELSYDLPERNAAPQNLSFKYDLDYLRKNHKWCFVRRYDKDNYDFGVDKLTITGTSDGIMEKGFPSMAAFRQEEFYENISCNVESTCEEAGLTVFMDERHHYDIYLDDEGNAVSRMTIGFLSKEVSRIHVGNKCRFIIESEPYVYNFYIENNGEKKHISCAESKYISTEVASGFTGVVIGLYAKDDNSGKAVFTELCAEHNEEIN